MIATETNKLKEAVEELRWKFSKIDGDPNLGEGVKCYATKQFNIRRTKDGVIKAVDMVAAQLHNNLYVSKVLRSKVELVIYDNRS